MKAWALGVLAAWAAAASPAATLVLDPGPGTDYLAVSCGGQAVNEIANGFDAAADAVTLVKVSTTCHGSGRGSPNQYYLACWTVTFGREGAIASKVWLATNHWQQGQPSIPCPVAADPSAVFPWSDGAGNFPATLSTTSVGTSSPVYRAVLETTCSAIAFGDSVVGTIAAAGASACHSFGGGAGNAIRASADATSGDLVPALEVRRPDGSVLCAGATANCTLDAAGLHTIVVRDAAGSGSGDYTLGLIRTDLPHLTVGMTAAVSAGRRSTRIDYEVAVGNDAAVTAPNVVVTDALPQGLSLRSLSSSQGRCTYSQRTITCTLGELPASGHALVKIGAATALTSGQITNTACVDAGNCATTTTSLP